MKFIIGYSGVTDHLASITNASHLISAVYTGGLAGKIAGGRPQYSLSLDVIGLQVALAHEKGLDFELALNAPCGMHDKNDHVYWKDMRSYLRDLESIGVDGIIASHPFVMTEVREHTRMYVVASTICEIMTPRMAEYFELIGAQVIIPSMNVNFNLQTLRLMKQALKTAVLRIMVNEHCLGDCPWRRFHHSHYAHSSIETDYHLCCKRQFATKPYLFLTNSVIRPEDLHRYTEITDQFKIVGRMVPIEDVVKQIKAYAAQLYDGNYLGLFDIGAARKISISNSSLNDLFEKKSRCNFLCDQCGFCKELFDKARDEKVLGEK